MMKESLFAAEEHEAKLDQLGDVLQVLEKHIKFTTLAAKIDCFATRTRSAKGGRPPFSTVIIVKALFLHLLNRLNFQHLVGLRHSS